MIRERKRDNSPYVTNTCLARINYRLCCRAQTTSILTTLMSLTEKSAGSTGLQLILIRVKYSTLRLKSSTKISTRYETVQV